MVTTKNVAKTEVTSVKDVLKVSVKGSELVQNNTEKKADASMIVPITIVKTASDRIKKLDNFNILVSKYNFLKTQQTKLEKFKIANDGTKIRLVLQTHNSEDFTVSNTVIINKALEVLSAELDQITEVAEKEVTSYVI
jgi:hypothetical protein